MLAVLSAAIRPTQGKVFQECRIVGLKGISYVIHVRHMLSFTRYCYGSRFYREHFWQVLDFPFPGRVTQKRFETAAVAAAMQ